MKYVAICKLEDIPSLGARQVRRRDGVQIAVFRTAKDRVFALLDRCPHKGGPLSEGIVYGDSVSCPLHSMSFDLASGCAHPPDEGCTPHFPVKVEEGIVYLAPHAPIETAEPVDKPTEKAESSAKAAS